MRLLFGFISFVVICSTARSQAAYQWGDTLVFSIRGEDATKPPFLRTFPGNLAKDGTDAGDTLATLKFGRGQSKLYPKEDQEKGLIVVFRTIAIRPKKDGKSYEGIFEGEFNAVRADISKEDVSNLLAGRETTLKFHSETNKGFFPVFFNVVSDTELLVHLDGKTLVISAVSGEAKIRHTNALTGFDNTFTSEKVVLEKEKGKPALYTGAPGELAKLPLLNP